MTNQHRRALSTVLFAAFLVALPASPRSEELTYRSGNAFVACTLSLPETSPAPHPAVILLCGTGLQERDWDIDGNGLYKMGKSIADPLVERGIAVLRCDDRGAGKTIGPSEWDTTFEEMTQDALAAVARLKARPDIGAIGIGGLSGGAEVATMAAAASSDVAFVVLMSGPFVPGADILMDQARSFPEMLIPEPAANRDALVEQAVRFQTLAVRAWRTGEGMDELAALVRKNTRYVLTHLPEPERKKIADLEAEIRKQSEDMMTFHKLAYFKSFVAYNPARDLPRLQCPILALYGAQDDRVKAEFGWKALLRTVASRESPALDVTLRVFPDTFHFLTRPEYARKGQLTPGVVDQIGDWIWERFGHPTAPSLPPQPPAAPVPAAAPTPPAGVPMAPQPPAVPHKASRL